MIMTNFLQKRRTVRDFKAKPLSQDILNKVREILDQTEAKNMVNALQFGFYENGDIIADALEGKAGYGGVMIHAPHYISLEMNSSSESERIRLGYLLESVNTALVEEGLGTCWITIDRVDIETKKRLFGEAGEAVDFLIGIGEAKGKKIFSHNQVTPRLSIDKFVFKDDFDTPASVEELEQRGLIDVFSSVRFAPSHMNSQPWRFLIQDEKINLYMVRSKWDQRSLVDIGVMMFYFEAMANSMGNHTEWELLDQEDKNELKPIAQFIV